MATIKAKSGQQGRRSVVKAILKQSGMSEAGRSALERRADVESDKKSRLKMRHKGGGHKHHYRVVDFVRNKDGIPAKVERIEYDPNRTAHIALVCYADGERRYIIAPRGLAVGATILSGTEAPVKIGNALPIRNIPVGSTIHNIEMLPGKGGQIARSAGTSAVLIAREGTYAQVRLRSGEIRKIHIECRATLGEVALDEGPIFQFGKTGVVVRKSRNPTARKLININDDHRQSLVKWHALTMGARARKSNAKHVFLNKDLNRHTFQKLPPTENDNDPEPVLQCDKYTISQMPDDELSTLLSRIPSSQIELIASYPAKLNAIIYGESTIDGYVEKLMAPSTGCLQLDLVPAPLSDAQINDAVAVGLFPSGAIRTVGTVSSHSGGVAIVEPYNIWSLIDPFDDAQNIEPDKAITLDAVILLMIGR